MKQYLDLCQRIVDEGEGVNNERTGKKCLTVINADLEYDVENNQFPLITTRKSFWKAAIAEMLGYLRGYSSAAQFREIGCNTWNANANDNTDWLNNPHRKGEDDMGRVYGVQGRSWMRPDGTTVDQFKKIIDEYTNTEYELDYQFKLDLINDILASKEMYIGRYYFQKKKWIPAINRLKNIVNNYSETVFVEEALHRLVEIYYRIGLIKEAKAAAAILGYNYNSSEWYTQSYKVLNKSYKTPKKNEVRKDDGLIKRTIKKLNRMILVQ